MANLARDLTFFIRAENQASRAIKGAARDFGGLAKLKDAQNAAAEASAKKILALNDKLARNQDALRANAARLNQAELTLQRTRENAVAAAVRGDEAIAQAQVRLRKSLTALSDAEAKLAETRKATTIFGQPNQIRALPNKSYAETRQILESQAESLATLNRQHELLQNSLVTAQGVPASVIANANQAMAAQAEQIQIVTENRRKLIGASKDLTSAIEAEDAALTRNTELMSLQKWGVIGAGLQRVGRIARLTGVVVGAAFAFMAKKAADFQTSVTLAATQTTLPGRNTTAQTLANSRYLQDQILRLEATGKVTSSLTDQTSSAYQIFSSVSLKGNQAQQLKEGIKLLGDFNKVATANYGMVSLNDVVNAGTFLMNRFHVSVANMPEALNRMQAAVRYGAMNMQQFVKGVGQVGPAFNAAGYSFDQMAASMAFVSRKFSANPQMGFTGLSRLTETFANKKLRDGLKAQGVQVEDLTGHLLPLDQIIANIVKKWPDLAKGGTALQDFFKTYGGATGTVQARRVFVSIIQDLGGYRKMIKNVLGDNNELTKSFDAMQKSPQVNWAEFTNKLKSLTIAIGTQAIPMIIHLFGWMGKLVTSFNNLSPSSKKLIAEIGIFGSVGLIVVGTLAGIAGSFLKLYEATKIMRTSGGIAKMLGLGGEVGSAAPEVAVLIAALAALGYILVKHPQWIKDVVNAMGGLKGVLIAVGIIMTAFIGKMVLLKTTELGFSMFKAIEAITLTGDAASVAGGRVKLLGGRLLGLAGIVIPAIVIPILYKASDSLTKSPIGKQHLQVPGGVVGLFDRVYSGAELLADKHIKGMTTAQARAQILKNNDLPGSRVVYTPNPQSWVDMTIAVMNSPLASSNQLNAIENALIHHDGTTIKKVYNDVLKLTEHSGGLGKLEAFGRSLLKYKPTKQSIANAVAGVPSYMTALRHVGDLEAIALKAPNNLADYKAYYAARIALDSEYADAAFKTFTNKYLSRVTSANKAAISQQVKDAKAAATELSNAYSNIMSTYNTFLSQNQSNFGSLFSGPFMSSPGEQARLGINNNAKNIRPDEVLRDLKSQLFQFNRLNTDLSRIKRRGGPQSLIDQLRAAGPGALPDIEAIMKGSGPFFRQYVATWQRSQKAIKDATLSQLNNQIGIYKQFGSKVALAIIAGIKGEDPKLQNELESVINKMFPDLVKKAGSAPHKVDSGSKHGFGPIQHQTTHHSTTNLHIHNPKSESVDTATKKALFAIKTRKH